MGKALSAQQTYNLLFVAGKLKSLHFDSGFRFPVEWASPDRPPAAEDVWQILNAPASGPDTIMVRRSDIDAFTCNPEIYPVGPDGQHGVDIYLRAKLPDGWPVYVRGVAPHLIGHRQFNTKTDQYDLIFQPNPEFQWKTMPVIQVDTGNSRDVIEYTTFTDYPLR